MSGFGAPAHRRRIITVNNRDRLPGETAARFSCNVPGIRSVNKVNGVAFRSLTFVNGFTNINRRNNQLVFISPAPPNNTITATVAIGQYTDDTFPVALTDAMIAADPGLTGSTLTTEFNATTGALSVTIEGTTQPFVLLSVLNASEALGQPDSLNRILGAAWTENTASVVDGVNTTLTPPGILDLSGPQIAYLCSDHLGNGNMLHSGGNSSLNTIATIPLPAFGDQVTFGVSDTHLFHRPLMTDVSTNGLIDWYFLDRDGRGMELPDNTPVSIEFELVVQNI